MSKTKNTEVNKLLQGMADFLLI